MSVRPGHADDLPYLGLEGIESGTGQFAEGELSKTPEAPQANSFRFDERHVLYGKLRPYLNKVALPTSPGKCSTEIIPLLPAPQLDRQYLSYFLRSPATVKQITERSSGARMPRADMDFVLSLPISLPAIEEQRRIVDLLARAEGIVRLRREAQQKTADLIPAIFIDMFGDPATNPKGWPLRQFGDVGGLDRGKSRHRPRDASVLYGGPYPFIQTGDVANSGGRIRSYTATYSEVGLAQSRLWSAGTLCITIAANIAKTGVLEFDACFPDSVVGFVPGDLVRVGFVQAWLGFLQPTLEANAPQAAQKNINLEILRALPVPGPPTDLQDVFVNRCERVVGISLQQASALTSARAAFDALLTNAFSEG
jgi:type I restriction enzyme S subunit